MFSDRPIMTLSEQLTRCTAKFMTAALPPAAVEATKEATTCYGHIRLEARETQRRAYLLELELARVEEVQGRAKPGEARVLDPLTTREILGPSDSEAIDQEEEEDRRDRDLDRLEEVNLRAEG